MSNSCSPCEEAQVHVASNLWVQHGVPQTREFHPLSTALSPGGSEQFVGHSHSSCACVLCTLPVETLVLGLMPTMDDRRVAQESNAKYLLLLLQSSAAQRSEQKYSIIEQYYCIDTRRWAETSK